MLLDPNWVMGVNRWRQGGASLPGRFTHRTPGVRQNGDVIGVTAFLGALAK